MSSTTTSQGKTPSDRPYVLYAASGLGSLFLGFFDLMNNGRTAMTAKMAEVLRTHLFMQDAGALFPLLFLAVMGCCVAWVYQPNTRIDAFSRGFALFALLSVGTPYGNVPSNLSEEKTPGTENPGQSFLGVSQAFAQDKFQKTLVNNPLKSIGLWIQYENSGGERPSYTRIAIRDSRTGRLLGQIVQDQHHSPMITIRRPAGIYLIEVEAPGYRRSAFKIEIGEDQRAYSVLLESTATPLVLQQLFPHKEIEAQKTQSQEMEPEQ